MIRVFWLCFVLTISCATWASAQSNPQTDSSAPTSKPQQSGIQQSAPQQLDKESVPSKIAPSTTLPKNPVQPPARDLSPDLSFPEDAGKPAPSGASPPAPSSPSSSSPAMPDLAPPRSDRVRVTDLPGDTGQSSSKETQEDLSAPEDDEKVHPRSSAVVSEAEAGITPGGVSEFKQWSPQRAAKEIEVGDYYFKRKNYKAAEMRYREALNFKDNDAVATIKLAISLEKLGVFDDARLEYESYLKILPYGPEAPKAHNALERLKKSQ